MPLYMSVLATKTTFPPRRELAYRRVIGKLRTGSPLLNLVRRGLRALWPAAQGDLRGLCGAFARPFGRAQEFGAGKAERQASTTRTPRPDQTQNQTRPNETPHQHPYKFTRAFQRGTFWEAKSLQPSCEGVWRGLRGGVCNPASGLTSRPGASSRARELPLLRLNAF